MSTVKIIELIGSSEISIEDAINQTLQDAAQTVKNIDSIYIKHIKVHVQNNQVVSYGLNCKVSFRIENNERKQGL
jgi:flavin-binding protein dodecin